MSLKWPDQMPATGRVTNTVLHLASRHLRRSVGAGLLSVIALSLPACAEPLSSTTTHEAGRKKWKPTFRKIEKRRHG